MFKRLASISIMVMFVLTLFTAVGTSAASKAEQVTLKYVSWMSKGEDKPILTAFMKANPNIKVEDEVFDGTQYDKLMKIRLLSDDAPDVFLIQAAQYKPYVKEGYLMDLTNLPGTGILKKSPTVADFYKINGKIYGNIVNGDIPINAVYYNKKYFTKLGIKPPTTVNEFLAVCKKIKADGKDPLVFGGKDRWPVDYFFRSKAFTGMLKNNLEWQLALYKGTLKPSQFYKAELEFLSNLVKNGYIGKPSLTLSYDQSVQYFADGKAGMMTQGTWIPSLDVIKKAKNLELGAFVLPTTDKIAMAAVDRSIVVSANSKHPAEAQKLYNFIMDAKNLKTYLESQSLTTLLNFDYKVDPVLKNYVKDLYNPKNHTAILNQKTSITPAFTDATWNAYVNILAGSTVKSELSKLDKEFAKTKSSMIVSGN